MKVFISHKQQDAAMAIQIQQKLKALHIDSYLDLLDASISGNGKELTNHVRDALNKCTDILVVMSENTKYSQWVPFEIGMAAERYLPTVTYLAANVVLPEFLSFWPRLRNTDDVAKYVISRNDAKSEIERRSKLTFMTAENKRQEEISLFYDMLKNQLR